MLLKTLYLTMAILALTLGAAAQNLARPALNSLEQRKGRDLQAAQNSAEAAIPAAQVALAKADLDVQTLNGKSRLGLSLKAAQQLSAQTAAAEKRTISIARKLAQAESRKAQVDAQMESWEASTIISHQGDTKTHRVDWQAGAIVEK